MNLIYGLFGLIIFVLDIWAIASVINSTAERNTKLIWIAIIALLPIGGLIAWWFVGPKADYG
ncbi:MAG: PLD nuclease N-terminal domain-containing protein [Paracoccus sp. (in: a-proteobacteria)]|nr:PLD nuclease N-terminal domain-containing protein [Paracoccus sp. (in: a-proteobacteria)]